MTDTTSKSTGRVPTFDGNAANFLMFATKNLSRPDIDRHGEKFSTDEDFG